MGLEAKCRAAIGGKKILGTLHVDAQELRFRAPALDWRLPLPGTEAKHAAGWLQVADAKFELGEAAERWLQKILYPPSRLDKLGIGPGHTVRIHGGAPADFLRECEAYLAPGKTAASIAIYFLQSPDDLPGIPAPELPTWLIYPKGGKQIREAEVMAWAKNYGLGASKTLSFDAQRTGLRFGRQASTAAAKPARARRANA